jgi:quercetin dioxygenase-like cupin family protein
MSDDSTTRPTVAPLEAEPSRISPASRFIGFCRVHQVADALGASGVEVNGLYFEAGARSRPHRHNMDQVLYFLQGPGIVAVDGGEDQLVAAEETVMLPAGVWHMHGAPAGNAAAHLSIMPAGHDNDFVSPVPEGWQRFREIGLE